MDKRSKPAKRRDVLTQRRPKWKAAVDEHDYTAAFEYLTLLTEEENATVVVQRLRDQETILKRKAKDILRATQLPLLPQTDEYVARDLVEIANGKKLSPILYVRLRVPIIADGYHRVCASYWCDPDTDVLMKMVG